MPGVDGITSEMLKCGREYLLKGLRTLCNACILEEKVPNDWMKAITRVRGTGANFIKSY